MLSESFPHNINRASMQHSLVRNEEMDEDLEGILALLGIQEVNDMPGMYRRIQGIQGKNTRTSAFKSQGTPLVTFQPPKHTQSMGRVHLPCGSQDGSSNGACQQVALVIAHLCESELLPPQ